jgi:hypothetical protein
MIHDRFEGSSLGIFVAQSTIIQIQKMVSGKMRIRRMDSSPIPGMIFFS